MVVQNGDEITWDRIRKKKHKNKSNTNNILIFCHFEFHPLTFI